MVIENQFLCSVASRLGLRPVLWCLVVTLWVCAATVKADSPPIDQSNNDAVSLIASTSYGPENSGDLEGFKVLFNFRPSIRAIGFLVAQQEGFYQAESLPPVKFLWNNRDLDWTDLSSGKVQCVATVFPRVIEACAQGEHVVILSQLVEKTSQGLLFRTDCHPKKSLIQDFVDARIGVCLEDSQLAKTLLHAHMVKYKSFSLAQAGYELLIPGGLDALCLHSYQHSGLTMYSRHRSLFTFIPLADAKNSMPEDCLCCDGDFVNANRDLCRGFIRASWQGWRLVASKPEKALATWKSYCHSNDIVFDGQVTRTELKNYISYLQLHSQWEQSGNLSPDTYKQAIVLLTQAGIISKEKAPLYKTVFEPIMLTDGKGQVKTDDDSITSRKERKRVP